MEFFMTDDFAADLSTGNYDDVEKNLSRELGVKVLLVRGWKQPETCGCEIKDGVETFSSDDPAEQELTRQMMAWWKKWNEGDPTRGERPEDIAARNTLRAYLYERDPAIGATIDDEEINSIVKEGHVTLRDGNCKPVRAVIVLDPIRHIPDKEKLTEYFFRDRWRNGWAGWEQQGKEIMAADFIENMDIDPRDYRIYKALMDIHYALGHQFDHDYERNTRNGAFHYLFTSRGSGKRLWQPYYDMSFQGARQKYEIESTIGMIHNRFGIRDENLIEKITLADAIMNLHYGNLAPNDTFARLANRYRHEIFAGVTDGEIKKSMDTLREAIEQEIKNRIDKGAYVGHMQDDFRALIPVFREVKDKLELSKPGKIYVDTVWKGVQKYLPSLADAPVPDMGKDSQEPPRSAAGYRAQGMAAPRASGPGLSGPA